MLSWLKASWFDDLLGLISVSHGEFVYLVGASGGWVGCCVVAPVSDLGL